MTAPAITRQSYLLERLTPVVEGANWTELEQLFHEFYLEDIAHLMRYFSPAQNVAMLQHLGPERAGVMLLECNAPTCRAVCASLPLAFLADVLSVLHTDDAADIAGHLPDGQRDQILAQVDGDHAERIRHLLGFHPETAGGIMSHHYIAVREDMTLEQAIEVVRDQESDFLAPRIFVVDAAGVLKGYLSSRRLLMKETDARIADIMMSHPVKVRTDLDQEVVAQIFARYDLVTLPVVDAEERLVGFITVDDVVDVIHAEATEDALKQGGTDAAELENPTVMTTVKSRLPWLFASWLGGVAALMVIGQFEDALKEAVVLSAFIPVVMGMGGNAGNQAATVIVRGLAMGFIHSRDILHVLFREFRAGLILGVTYGTLLGVLSHFRYIDEFERLGLVVGLSIVSVITMGVCVGTFFPMLFKRLNIDPAVATAPFVATSLDIGGILVYFMLAKSILGI